MTNLKIKYIAAESMKIAINNTCIDFTEIESGTMLPKFVAVDDAVEGGDSTVELHGFCDENSRIIITNVILRTKRLQK